MIDIMALSGFNKKKGMIEKYDQGQKRKTNNEG